MALVIKNAGKPVILGILGENLHLIEKAGRTCYRTDQKELTDATARAFTKKILHNFKHESVIEHSYMTVVFECCSRGMTHEQVRHRLTGISQESTRYVDYSPKGEVDLDAFQISVVAPPHRDEHELMDLGDGRKMSFVDMCNEEEKFYRALRKGRWKPEDARQILPNGITSQIVISANFREWRHIFKMRTEKVAHWEIRAVMCKLLEEVRRRVPVIFDDFVLVGNDDKGIPHYRMMDNEERKGLL